MGRLACKRGETWSKGQNALLGGAISRPAHRRPRPRSPGDGRREAEAAASHGPQILCVFGQETGPRLPRGHVEESNSGF